MLEEVLVRFAADFGSPARVPGAGRRARSARPGARVLVCRCAGCPVPSAGCRVPGCPGAGVPGPNRTNWSNKPNRRNWPHKPNRPSRPNRYANTLKTHTMRTFITRKETTLIGAILLCNGLFKRFRQFPSFCDTFTSTCGRVEAVSLHL